MLNFDYYFVDVGENYCTISKRNATINLVEAFKQDDKVKLIIAKKILIGKFKKSTPFFKEEEFKIVLVNKEDKLRIAAEVVNESTSKRTEPIADKEGYFVFTMSPADQLNVKCQVYPKETEYRSLSYKYVREPRSKSYRKYRGE